MSRILVIAGALLAASPAQAYFFIGCGWDITGYNGSCPTGTRSNDGCGCTSSSAPRWYGAQLSMRIENQGGNGITATDFVTAGRNSARSWTDVSCSTVQIDASQTFAAINTARWGDFNNNSDAHELFFVTSNSEWMQVTGSGAGGTLGVTVSPYSGWSCSDREFFDTDILINGFTQWGWTLDSVEGTVLHEMGHSVGLDHPCLAGYTGCGTGSCVAVMAASGGDYTTPQQDDVNGVCALYPGTPGGLGSACSSPSQCNQGFSCITHQGFSYCSQACGSCPTGYSCQAVSGGNYCVRRSVPGVGEPCTAQCADGAICMSSESGSGGTCYASCNPNLNNCTGGYRCVALQGGGGACFPPGGKQLGEVCSDPTECASGLICIGDQNVAHCERACDPSQPGSCGSGYMCADIGGGEGFCIEAASEGQSCTDRYCFDGLTCVGDGTNYTCHRVCNPDVANSCGETQTCFELSDGSGACFPRGDGQPGDACFDVSDCAQENLCVSTQTGGGQCMRLCDPSNPFCPFDGQRCIGLVGSTDGVCDPPTGGSCTCNTGAGCQSNCVCDPECGSSCACDTTASCSPGCPCDPECNAPCACDTSLACNTSCSCDPDCAGNCACNTSVRCEAGCACDPNCRAAVCTCDVDFYCDDSCACDAECPCECDQYVDECECDCDPDCAKQTCAGSSWGTALTVMAAGALLLRRKRLPRG
jgi:hypothetical protein